MEYAVTETQETHVRRDGEPSLRWITLSHYQLLPDLHSWPLKSNFTLLSDSSTVNCLFPDCRWQGTLSTSALPLIIVSHVQTGSEKATFGFVIERVLSKSNKLIQQKWFLNTSETCLSSHFLLEGLNYHMDLSCMYILSLSCDRWLVSGHICSCILPHKKAYNE